MRTMSREIIEDCLDEWDWDEEAYEVKDHWRSKRTEIERAARQVMEMAASDDDPEQTLPNIAGKLNRIEVIADGRIGGEQ